jgi:hypothetical protein
MKNTVLYSSGAYYMTKFSKRKKTSLLIAPVGNRRET